MCIMVGGGQLQQEAASTYCATSHLFDLFLPAGRRRSYSPTKAAAVRAAVWKELSPCAEIPEVGTTGGAAPHRDPLPAPTTENSLRRPRNSFASTIVCILTRRRSDRRPRCRLQLEKNRPPNCTMALQVVVILAPQHHHHAAANRAFRWPLNHKNVNERRPSRHLSEQVQIPRLRLSKRAPFPARASRSARVHTPHLHAAAEVPRRQDVAELPLAS